MAEQTKEEKAAVQAAADDKRLAEIQANPSKRPISSQERFELHEIYRRRKKRNQPPPNN